MSKFLYVAKSYDGEEQQGELEAAAASDVAAALRERKLAPTLIRPADEKRRKILDVLRSIATVPLSEKMMLTRNLAVMVSSGLTISKAVKNLSLQTKNGRLRSILRSVHEDLLSGKTLADSLQRYEHVFGGLFINMIRAGESSGNLEEVLKILATQLEKEHAIIRKVRGALIYPSVVLAAMVGVAILMMIYVIPRITEVFTDLNVELPVTTKTVIAVSTFMATYPVLFLGLLFGTVVGIVIFSKTRPGRRALSFLLVFTPFVKNIVIKVNCARFARVYSSLARSGISVVETLGIISRTLTNMYYQRAVKSCEEKIQKGMPLSEIIKEFPRLFPPLVWQMLEVGEETGKTEVVLLKLAQFYEEAIDQITKNLSSIIEPILMIFIGGAVGFFAVSILEPMYSVLDKIE